MATTSADSSTPQQKHPTMLLRLSPQQADAVRALAVRESRSQNSLLCEGVELLLTKYAGSGGAEA